MRSKFIQISIFLAIAMGTMGDTCVPDYPTLATGYKAAIVQTLGVDYTEWANYAMTGRLGSCVLAKPPTGTPHAARCSYYIRTKITNSQGLKGWPGGTGCIPNPNYYVNGNGGSLWGHTYTTLGNPTTNSTISSYPTNEAGLKTFAGQKIAALFQGDSSDTFCDIATYVSNNQTRLSAFNSIDYLTASQLNHIIFAQQVPGGPVSCGYYLPDKLPWLNASGIRECRQPLFPLSANFCKIAYNRYILNHGGQIPTIGSGMIAYSDYTTLVAYQNQAVIENPEAISSLTSKFSAYDIVPQITDFIPQITTSTQDQYANYNSSMGIPGIALPGSWTSGIQSLQTTNFIFTSAFANYTSATQRTPLPNSFKGVPISMVSPSLLAFVTAIYNDFSTHYGMFTAYGQLPGESNAAWAQDHPGFIMMGGSPPELTYHRVIAPPNTYAYNPYTDNTGSLSSYAINNPPGLGGIPFNLINGATITYDYANSQYKIQNGSFTSFVSAQPFTQFYSSCGLANTWSSLIAPVIESSGLTMTLPNPPGNI